MPPRDPNLPEGTDSIIDGTADLSGSSSGMGAGSGLGSSVDLGAGDDDDFMGASDAGSASLSGGGLGGSSGLSSGTDYASTSISSTGSSTDYGTSSVGAASSGAGGMSSGMGNMGASGSTSGMSGAASTAKDAAAEVGGAVNVQSLKTQASDKVRDAAEQGKTKATEALGNVQQMVTEAAETVDERLGPQYGDYVRRAAGALEGLNSSIQGKNIDELYDDARTLVRKSPGIAIGAAALVGFLLVRLVKSGMPQDIDNDDYYSTGSTQRLGTPPRVDNSYDPVA